MSIKFDGEKLHEWAQAVLDSQTTFFRTRKQLFKKFLEAKHPDGGHTMDTSEFQTVKNFLTSRNDKLNDDKTLAFDTIIAALIEQLEPEAEEQKGPRSEAES